MKKTDDEILMMRRDLSGIYIFDTLPQDDGKRRPTCLEDCRESTLYSWLWAQEEECLLETHRQLVEVMRRMKEMFTPEESATFRQCELETAISEGDDKLTQIEEIVKQCKIIKLVACHCGISAPGSECAPDHGKEEGEG